MAHTLPIKCFYRLGERTTVNSQMAKPNVAALMSSRDHFHIPNCTQQTYVASRIARLEASFLMHGIEMCARCSKGISSDCWLLDSLTPWNRVLHPAGIEICELEPGTLTVRSTNLRPSISSEDGDMVDASFVVYWLLERHTCINCIRLLDSPSWWRCSLDIKFAMTLNTHVRRLALCHRWQCAENGYHLTDALGTLSTIAELDLSGFDVDNAVAEDLASILRRNDSITFFAVCCLYLSAQSYERVLNSLVDSKNLAYLGIHSAHDRGGTAVGDFLRRNRSIRTFSLDGNRSIGANGCRLILQGLYENGAIEVLDLSGCNIGDVGARILSNILSKPEVALKKVSLSGCTIGAMGAAALAESLKHNSQLTDLDLAFNMLGDEGAAMFADTIKSNKTLKKLNISECSVTSHGVALLAETLASDASPREVYVGKINVPPTRNLPLSPATRQMLVFSRLQVSWNNDGLHELAHAIRNSSSMETIRVDRPCPMTSEGFYQVFDALRWNKTVTTLILHLGNTGNISNEAIRELGEVLSNSKTLKSVRIENEATFRPLVLAYVGLAAAKSVAHFQVKDQFWNLKSVRAFSNAIQANTSLQSLTVDSQHLAKTAKFLKCFSKGVYANHSLMSVKLKHLEGTTRSAFRIHEACRRNLGVLGRAARFVLGTSTDRSSAEAFENVHECSALTEHLARTTNLQESEACSTIQLARRFLRLNYFKLTNIVKDRIVCGTSVGTVQIEQLNEDCLDKIVSFLRIADVAPN